MVSPLLKEWLAGDSKEVRDLADNEAALTGFLALAKDVNDLPDMDIHFYDAPPNLYQVISTGHAETSIAPRVTAFFGEPVKIAGKSGPLSLRFDPIMKYVGGIRKDQTLFLKKLKTGSFFCVLWTWAGRSKNTEIRLGWCFPDIQAGDYARLCRMMENFLVQKNAETLSGIGGAIHGISLPSFLQMSEMEEATYTLRVTSGNRQGCLYLSGGNLIDARYGEMTGSAAAYRIISWENASIQIEAADPERVREIHEPLMHVMMESMKIKDEVSDEEARAASSAIGSDASDGSAQFFGDMMFTPLSVDELEDGSADMVTPPKPADPGKEKWVRMTPMIKRLIGAACVVLLVVAVIAGVMVGKKRSIANRYSRLMAELATTKALDARVVLLMKYIQDYPEDSHRAEIEDRLRIANKEMEDEDYTKTVIDVEALPIDDQYENKALSLYTAFLARYPESVYAPQIDTAIAGVREKLGRVYFENLKNSASTDFIERYTAYQAYIKQFPDSAERKTIDGMMKELSEDYAASLEKKAAICDKQEKWSDCIVACDEFLSHLTNTPTTERIRQLRSRMVDKKEFVELLSKADAVSDDWIQTLKVYTDYLAKRPETTQRSAIEERIHAFDDRVRDLEQWNKIFAYANSSANPITDRVPRLDAYIDKAPDPYATQARLLRERLTPEYDRTLQNQKIAEIQRREQARKQAQQAQEERERQRIAQLRERFSAGLKPVASRFHDNGNGTVTDRVTGLTWVLLDSTTETGKCMNFRAAQTYVKKLSTGGYSDWRLPNAGELATIYKNAPFFPGSGAEWYWTSESFARGYHQVVDVVTTKQETVFQRISKPESNCGAVRAVRR